RGRIGIEQSVQMDDEVAHLRIVDRLLRLAPPKPHRRWRNSDRCRRYRACRGPGIRSGRDGSTPHRTRDEAIAWVWCRRSSMVPQPAGWAKSSTRWASDEHKRVRNA